MEQSYPLHYCIQCHLPYHSTGYEKAHIAQSILCHTKHLNLHCLLLFFSLRAEQNYLKTALLLIVEVIISVVQRKSGDLIIIWALIDSLISWQLMS